MKTLVIATGNQDKVAEIKSILKSLKLKILSKNEVGLSELEVIEDAETLKGNATLKAKAILENCNAEIVLADDTGLYVDALSGLPGVHTARYAGEHASYADNRIKLLKDMQGVEEDKRTARFITSIVVLDREGNEYEALGVCEGKISTSERGDFGFGYDPIFIPEGYDKTFAELDSDTKNKISHRALALGQLKALLEKIGVEKNEEDSCSK